MICSSLYRLFRISCPFLEGELRFYVGQFPGGRSRDLAVLPDGRFVLTGEVVHPTVILGPVFARSVVLARLWPDGTRDRTFDGDGLFIGDEMVTSLGKQIAPQVDGKLVVSGDFDPSSDLARFDVPEICPAAPRVGCDATWARRTVRINERHPGRESLTLKLQSGPNSTR